MRTLRWPRLALASLLGVAGCAGLPDFPAALPALQRVDLRPDRVPDVTGRFVDLGEGYSPSSRSLPALSLTALLHGGNAATPPAEQVEIERTADGALVLRSFRGGQRVAELLRREGPAVGGTTLSNYVANQGFVWILLYAGNAGAAGIGGALGEESLWLRKARDGSLIVLHRVLYGGVIGVVPFAGRRDSWYRFAPASGPDGGG